MPATPIEDPADAVNPAMGDAAARFAHTMGAIGDFETRPHLAVAVSGGADSMALCLLARDWAAAGGGRVTALTVDHGLRPASTDEAGRIAGWMRAAGIGHHVLRWTGDKPLSGIQQAARRARYRLLLGWCREAAVLHLLLGHHCRDQAETVLHRALRASGTAGLAGMAAILETAHVRLLRPLLGWSPDELRRLLRHRRCLWLEDPSNADQRFARARLRAAGPSLAAAGITTRGLLALAADAVVARRFLQEAVIGLVAAACRVHPAGFARLDRKAWTAAPAEVTSAGLARLLLAVGGAEYPPAADRVRALLRGLDGPESFAATLGRCRIIARGGDLWLFREARNLPGEQPLAPGEELIWDGRFSVVCGRAAGPAAPELRIRHLVPADAAILRTEAAPNHFTGVPHLARVTVPILCDESGPVMAPLLGYRRRNWPPFRAIMVQMVWGYRQSIAEPGYFQDRES